MVNPNTEEIVRIYLLEHGITGVPAGNPGNIANIPQMAVYNTGGQIYAVNLRTGQAIAQGIYQTDDESVIEAAISAMSSNETLWFPGSGTYKPAAAINITKTIKIEGTQRIIFQAAASAFAFQIGDGLTRVADNCEFCDFQVQEASTTASGGIKQSLVVNLVLRRVIFSKFTATGSFALYNDVSWETCLYDCRFFNLHNGWVMDGVSYGLAVNTYFGATDYGSAGATTVRGVWLKNGALYAENCRFETDGTIGIGCDIEFYGDTTFNMCKWEGGQNLYDIRITQDLNYPCWVIGNQPVNKISGAIKINGLMYHKGLNQIQLNHDAIMTTVTGAGSYVTKSAGGLFIGSGTDNNNVTKAFYQMPHANFPATYYLFEKIPSFECDFYLNDTFFADYWITMGGDPQTATNKHFGIHIAPPTSGSNLRVFLTSGDGTTGGETDTTVTVVTGVQYHLRCFLTYPTRQVRWELDGTTQTGSRSSNIPSTNSGIDVMYIEVKTTEAGVDKDWYVSYPVITTS